MQRLLFYLSLAAILNTSAFAQKVIKDPNAEVRQVASFHAIHISDAFDVILTQGSEAALAVSANDVKFLADIKTSVENGILKIRSENDKKIRLPGNRKLKAYISVKNLDELKVSGASEVKIENSLKTNHLKLDVNGASKVQGNLLITGNLNIDLSGASDVNITGSANQVSIDANGASDVKAFDFHTSIADIKASGACNIRITIDKELSARLSGASNVAYKGNAIIKDIKTSGASNINRRS